MKKLIFILALMATLRLSSLGLASDVCPLEGTPQCPKVPSCCEQ